MEQIKEIPENQAESLAQKVEKLEGLLAPYLNEKVNLYHQPYSNRYGIALTRTPEGEFHGMLVDPAMEDQKEVSQLLTDVYNGYLEAKKPGEERKYDTAAIDPKTNSTTQETLEASGFVLGEFLKDLKK